MDPINYMGQFQPVDIGRAFTQGLQASGLQQQQDFQAQQQAAALQQQQAAQQQALRYQSDVDSFMRNPTAQGAAALTIRYPQAREAVQAGWKGLDAEQQKNELGQATQVYSALNAGRPDIAQQVVQQHIAGLKNTGQDTTELDNLLNVIKSNPDQAKGMAGLTLAHVLGPDKFTSMFTANSENARADALQPAKLQEAQAGADIKSSEAGYAPQKNAADIQNTQSQILERSARLGLDTDRLKSEYGFKAAELARKPGAIDLSPAAQKVVDDSVQEATLSRQSSSQLHSLADQIETANPESMGSGAVEFLKQATGKQDYISSLRGEIGRVMNSDAIRAYKAIAPGTFSDMDIKTATGGVPSANSPPKYVASYLRGVAKIQDIGAQVNEAKSDWASQVGGLQRASRDIEVNGTKVPSGTSFNDYLRKAIKPAGSITQPPANATLDRLTQKYGATGTY
jgi:hypothetical protein